MTILILNLCYNFLIAKRANIANVLTPRLVDDINTRREQPFHTIISSENGYADYLYSVTELFDDLFDKAKSDNKNDEDKENPGMANMMAIHYFSISPVSKKDNKKIQVAFQQNVTGRFAPSCLSPHSS